MFASIALQRRARFSLALLLACLAVCLSGPVDAARASGQRLGETARQKLADFNVLVTNNGHNIATGLMIKVGSGMGSTVPSYVGWGTGTTSAAAADTNLQTPSNEARVNCTMSQVTTSITNDTMQAVGTITSNSTQAITECGLFDAAGSATPPSGGNLFLHAVFSALNLNSGDSVTFTIKVQLV